VNKFFKSTLGVSLAGLIVLLATNGAALVNAALGAWQFLLTLADTAPLGLSSFVLALALAVAAQPFVRKWIAPRVACLASREFVIESAALVIAIAVMWIQTRDLSGLLLGILAGFAAPYVQKALAALGALAYRAYVGEPDAPSCEASK
jgi:hypothetical protein